MKNKIIFIIVFFIALAVTYVAFLPSKNNEEVASKLVISEKSITVKIGEKYKIDAYVENYPDATFLWKSTSDDVATVYNGTVTAIDYGSASVVIIATYGDNQTLIDYCTVKVVSGNTNARLLSSKFPDGDLLLGLNKPYAINEVLDINPKDSLIESKRYESADINTVSISPDGTIKCINIGNTAINVILNNSFNNFLNISCVDENISPTFVVNPTKIRVDDAKINVGETKKLNYEIMPETADMEYITFSSQDSSIVSVDDSGNIKGLKAGTTVISIKSMNGLVGECTVTVSKPAVLVTAINVEKTKVELNVGDKYTLSPTVTPSNAENNYLFFTSSNNSVATISMNGNQNSITVSAVSSGSSVITITTNNGVSKQVIVTVKQQQQQQQQSGSSSKNSTISFSEYPLTSANIISTGNINSSLLSSPSDSNFDLCKKESPQLTLKINGTTVGQDGSVTVRAGNSFRVEVYLPTKCGKILTLTRTSPDGSSSWSNYFLQNDNPFVDRDNSNTYLSGVTKYTWTIAAKKTGTCTLSQTAQFDVQSPNGRKANIKSMIRLQVKAT